MSAASLRPNFYSPSGLVPVAAWIMVAALLIPLAFISGIVYCAAVVFIPAVKMRWIASLGLGWVLGSLAAKLCRLGKVRATLFAVGATGVAVAAAYYSAWGMHRALLTAARLGADVQFNQELVRGFLPTEIVRWMGWQVRNIGGPGLRGWPLVGVWMIELGAIIYFTRATFLAAWDERPFCEACDRWTVGPEELVNLPVSPADPAWQRVGEIGPDAIRKLQLTEDHSERVVLSVRCCPECDRSNYLSAAGGGWHANEQGETSYQETTVLRNMAVTAQQIEELRALGDELEEAYRELSQVQAESGLESESVSYSDSAASSP
jgi:hypothetical protein